MNLTKAQRLALSASLSVFLTGCGAPNYSPSEMHITVEQVDSEAPAAPKDIPALVRASPTLPVLENTEGSATFDVVVTNVPVRDLLFALARDAGVNMDVDARVGGVVTMSALDQTLEAILERISQQVDMRVDRVGVAMIIKPDEPYYKKYAVDFINIEREFESSAETADLGDAGEATIDNESESKFWEELDDAISVILQASPRSGGDSGAAVSNEAVGEADASERRYSSQAFHQINKEVGLVVVYAPSRLQQQVEEYLSDVQRIAKRQVLLEATVVEVVLNNQYAQGIDWSIFNSLANDGFAFYQGGQVGGNAVSRSVKPLAALAEDLIARVVNVPLGALNYAQQDARVQQVGRPTWEDFLADPDTVSQFGTLSPTNNGESTFQLAESPTTALHRASAFYDDLTVGPLFTDNAGRRTLRQTDNPVFVNRLNDDGQQVRTNLLRDGRRVVTVDRQGRNVNTDPFYANYRLNNDIVDGGIPEGVFNNLFGETDRRAAADARAKVLRETNGVDNVRVVRNDDGSYRVQYDERRENNQQQALNNALRDRQYLNSNVNGGGLVPAVINSDGNFFTGVYRSGDVSAAVQLLDKFGDAKVLSSPRISTLNNQPALLRVVDQEVYFSVEIEEDRNADGNLTGRTITAEANTVDIGFSMNVLSQISEDGEVILNLKPSVTRILGFATSPDIGALGSNTSTTVPITRVRELESVISLRNGEVAVLGGLLEDRTTDDSTGIPGLNSLPGVGKLFEKVNQTTFKTEFIVFIKANVISDPTLHGDYRAYKQLLPSSDFIIRDRETTLLPPSQKKAR